MERYINFGGDQTIAAFDIYPDAIRVDLTNGDSYLYSESGVGSQAIQRMKSLAVAGGELAQYIQRNVAQKYDMRVHHTHSY